MSGIAIVPSAHLEVVQALHQMLSNHRSYQVLKGTREQKHPFSYVALMYVAYPSSLLVFNSFIKTVALCPQQHYLCCIPGGLLEAI